MTSVAPEASALHNRPSSTRPAAKSAEADGVFAAMVDDADTRRDAPKAAPPKASRSRAEPEPATSQKPDSTTPVAETGDSTVSTGLTDRPTGAEASTQPAETLAPAETLVLAESLSLTEALAPAETVISATDKTQTDATPAISPAIVVAVAVPVPAPIVIAAVPVGAPPAEADATPVAPVAPGAAQPIHSPAQAEPLPVTPQAAAPSPVGALAENSTREAQAAPDANSKAIAAAAATLQTMKPKDAVKDAATVVADDEALATATPDEAEESDDKAKPVQTNSTQTAAADRKPTLDQKPEGSFEPAFKPDDASFASKSAADAALQLTPHPTPHAATTAAPQGAPIAAAQPIPVNALAVEIAGQAKAGNSRFEIRLDPPELGRIDVRLDVDRDGNVTSRLVIERADTYDLLRRDQSTLERALQQAGLKTADNALEFQLRDQGFAQHRQHQDLPHRVQAVITESDIAPAEAASGYARLLNGRGGIDIRV